MVHPHRINVSFGAILNYKPCLLPPKYRCHICGSWITEIRSLLKVMDHHNHIVFFFIYTSHFRHMALLWAFPAIGLTQESSNQLVSNCESQRLIKVSNRSSDVNLILV